MTKILIDQIRKLRKKTAAPVMECRQALEGAKGSFQKAEKILKEKGVARARRKTGRKTSCGLIESYVHGGRIGAMVELCCETDFVARTDEFASLAHELAMQVASMNPKDTKKLLSQEYIRDPKMKVDDLLKQAIGKLGENITIGRFERFELGRG